MQDIQERSQVAVFLEDSESKMLEKLTEFKGGDKEKIHFIQNAFITAASTSNRLRKRVKELESHYKCAQLTHKQQIEALKSEICKLEEFK